jgi:hypothetical protein
MLSEEDKAARGLSLSGALSCSECEYGKRIIVCDVCMALRNMSLTSTDISHIILGNQVIR